MKTRARFTKAVIAVLVSGLFAHNIALANRGGINTMTPGPDSYVGTHDKMNIAAIKANVTVTNPGSGGSVFEYAFGGYSDNIGTVVEDNTLTVNIKKRLFLKGAYGGLSVSDTATGNTVNIKNGRIENVLGGAAERDATDNTVNISGGEIIGSVYGGSSFNLDAIGKTANISNKTITITTPREGYVRSGLFNADSNTVNINAGIINHVCGGFTNSGSVNDNTIKVDGGIIKGTICGGLSNSGSANNNVIYINGGKINQGYIYGGWAGDGVTNNKVILSGNPDLKGTTICGGHDDSHPISSGNVLEVRTKEIIGIGDICGFETIHFLLPADIKPGQTVLTANKIDADNMKISVGISSNGAPTLKEGDQIILIQLTSEYLISHYFQECLTQVQNLSPHYEFSLSTNRYQLIATVKKVID